MSVPQVAGERLSRVLKLTQQVVNTQAQQKIVFQDRIQQGTVEQVVDKHVQHVVNTVDVIIITSQSVKKIAERERIWSAIITQSSHLPNRAETVGTQQAQFPERVEEVPVETATTGANDRRQESNTLTRWKT